VDRRSSKNVPFCAGVNLTSELSSGWSSRDASAFANAPIGRAFRSSTASVSWERNRQHSVSNGERTKRPRNRDSARVQFASRSVLCTHSMKHAAKRRLSHGEIGRD
jgi:hypothetical protein